MALALATATPKATATIASAFETSIMQNLYASEQQANERQDKQPEQKAKDSRKAAGEEHSTQAKIPGSIADILNEMRESGAFRIGGDAESAKRQEDQDDAGQKS